MNKTRPFLIMATLALAGITTGLLIAALMLEGWLRYFHKLDLQQYAVWNRLDPEATTRYRPAKDMLLGWERADCTDDRPFGTANEYPVRKGRDVYRILVVGDSITEDGRYVQHLRRLFGASPYRNRFEVWYCGVAGYNLRQYYYTLKYKGFKLDPDMIILGLCLNDGEGMNLFASRDSSGRLLFFGVPYISGGVMEMNRTLFFHSHAYRFVMLAILKRLCRPGEGESGCTPEQAMNLIAEEAKKREIPILAVIFPYLKSKYSPLETAQHAFIMKTVANARVHVCDLHGAFANIDDPSWRIDPRDSIHPDAKGHKLIAEKIFEYLSRDPGFWYKEKHN